MDKSNYIIKGKEKINVGLTLVIFTENNQFVVYSPALDLSSYGDTKNEALISFKESLEIFLDYTLKKGTLNDILLDLGWTIKLKPKPKYIPPDFEEIKQTNNILITLITSNQQFKITEKKVTIPV